jgi:hypothetical protein
MPALSDICVNCGENFGRHFGVRCPLNKGTWASSIEAVATVETPSKFTGKPRTRQPELPVEVWNVRKVDPDLAIQAVRDMCKGA